MSPTFLQRQTMFCVLWQKDSMMHSKTPPARQLRPGQQGARLTPGTLAAVFTQEGKLFLLNCHLDRLLKVQVLAPRHRHGRNLGLSVCLPCHRTERKQLDTCLDEAAEESLVCVGKGHTAIGLCNTLYLVVPEAARARCLQLFLINRWAGKRVTHFVPAKFWVLLRLMTGYNPGEPIPPGQFLASFKNLRTWTRIFNPRT